MVRHAPFKWLMIGTVIVLLQSMGCSTPTRQGAKHVGQAEGRRAVTEVELQEDLQRFVTVFADRLAQVSSEIGPNLSPRALQAGMRQVVLYLGATLEIATEPSPELGLLDMLVFVTLNKDSLENHWVPKVLGRESEPLLRVFQRAETEIWAIAAKVMTSSQEATVRGLIRQWQKENPGQYRVEGVRLGTFSRRAGVLAEERDREASGLLSSVSAAVQSADQAVLLGDRAMFMAQRMPSLLRLQARLGMSELLSDLKIQMLLSETGRVSEKAGIAADQGRRLVDSLAQVGPYLISADRILDKSMDLFAGLQAAGPADRLDRLMRTVALYALFVGVTLTAIFWSGYYWARRALAKAAARERRR